MRALATSLCVVAATAIAACGSRPGAPGFADDDAGEGGVGSLTGQSCPQGVTTSVSGTVFDPAGKVPLYNVIVYVPGETPSALPEGVTCDKCGSIESGHPLTVGLTDETGHFSLSNVPAGSDVPLVMQIGKWRRQVTIPTVTACADTAVPPALSRLPRSRAEGDIPRIALVTGGCDPLECLLRKIGIDDSEFGGPDDRGARVHVFTGYAGAYTNDSADATELYTQKDRLMAHDMVLLGCECATHPETKPAASLRAMFDYASAGGRIFASHYHYYWLEDGPAPFPQTAAWQHVDTGLPQSIVASVDQTFPKGKAFASWLVDVGASSTAGSLPIEQPREDVASVGAPSQRWVYSSDAALPGVQYYTFNTPIDATDDAKCGRVVYSDLHVASADTPGLPIPSGCVTTDMSPQEKALEFMLFDLSSCVQTDNKPPETPR